MTSLPSCTEQDCSSEATSIVSGVCKYHYHKAYREKNREKLRQQAQARKDADRESYLQRKRDDYFKHKESILEKQKLYREQNAELIKERKRTEYLKHSDTYKARAKSWRKNNPEAVAELRTKDRAIRSARVQGVKYERVGVITVLKVYGTLCNICGEEIDLDAPRSAQAGENWQRGLHLDHVIPLSRGGTHTLDNLRPAHALCNIRKNRRLTSELDFL